MKQVTIFALILLVFAAYFMALVYVPFEVMGPVLGVAALYCVWRAAGLFAGKP